MLHSHPLRIAVIGSGISGLSCAWLLSQRHDVTLFEKDDRLGGHSNTVEVNLDDESIPVDTGFIVYNPKNYPNLVALFKHLDVPVTKTDMSFAVSANNGQCEYSGSGLKGLFAQHKNLFSPRFLGMVWDILRFYKETSAANFKLNPAITLRELIAKQGYGEAFTYQHLLPMGAAIWSTPMDKMLDYPAQTFIDFCQNHGLLQIKDRPEWHTVIGGSREYVQRLSADFKGKTLLHRSVRGVRRMGGKVLITDWQGDGWQFDHVVFACHADQALKLMDDMRPEEEAVLKHFKFARNRAVLHSDKALMPANPKVWSSWNYLSDDNESPQLCVSYWMNKLQPLNTDQPMIVTLNPIKEPAPNSVHASFLYDHPLFDTHTQRAQKQLWDIQGGHNTWFCGAWSGFGFHEDGLQSGLIVAEKLGGVVRPWTAPDMNARIPLPAHWSNEIAPKGAAA